MDYQSEYQEVPVDTVMRHFAQGFKARKGREIPPYDWTREWFYDPKKGVVIFKITTRAKSDEKREGKET
jgi:hypothetical protein